MTPKGMITLANLMTPLDQTATTTTTILKCMFICCLLVSAVHYVSSLTSLSSVILLAARVTNILFKKSLEISQSA